MDGLAVLTRLCADGNPTPVIVLTARGSSADIVLGLDSGADDYLAKPFRLDELLARIRTRLRDDPARPDDVTTCGDNDLQLDLRTRQARTAGRRVDLSAREFALAETLVRNAGQFLSREQLLDRVWGYDYDPGSNIVDVYMAHLRRKLGPERFQTLRGVGYRFRADQTDQADPPTGPASRAVSRLEAQQPR